MQQLLLLALECSAIHMIGSFYLYHSSFSCTFQLLYNIFFWSFQMLWQILWLDKARWHTIIWHTIDEKYDKWLFWVQNEASFDDNFVLTTRHKPIGLYWTINNWQLHCVKGREGIIVYKHKSPEIGCSQEITFYYNLFDTGINFKDQDPELVYSNVIWDEWTTNL